MCDKTLLLLFVMVGLARARVLTTEVYDHVDVVLSGPPATATLNPFADVGLTATFSLSGGGASTQVAVTGFYDGEARYIVRFMPSAVGNWSWTTACSGSGRSGTACAGLDGKTGVVVATARVTPGNRGVARTSAPEGVGFTFDGDGSAFIPVGTTSYAWLHQPQGDPLEEQTLASLKGSPFNKIRMTIFPKWYPFTHDEPRWYPFQGNFNPWNSSWDYARFNPTFWQHVERRVLQLRDMNVIAELILFHPYDGGHWGFDRINQNCKNVSGVGSGLACDQYYVKYAVARLSGFRNVWWSMANEWDIEKSKTVADWDSLFQTLQASDPYDKERSIHNCIKYYNHSQPWISHISLQGHDVGQLDMAKDTWWTPDLKKPLVWDEVEYEGNITYGWGRLTGKEESQRFWTAATNLAHCAGHSNTALLPENLPNCSDPNNDGTNGKPLCNPVMWWNKGGVLRGESPPRIQFYRQQMADMPVYKDMNSEKLWVDTNSSVNGGSGVFHAYAKDGSWHLVWWLKTAHPVDIPIHAESSSPFDATHIDYWNMTTTEMGHVQGVGGAVHWAPPYASYVLKLTRRTDEAE